jgi:hypothetical protein
MLDAWMDLAVGAAALCPVLLFMMLADLVWDALASRRRRK